MYSFPKLYSGYSWFTNQRGLTMDNIVKYELVLPNGTVQAVTADDSNLFFALKVWAHSIVRRVAMLTDSDIIGRL